MSAPAAHRPLRVGIVGAGGISHAHIPALQSLGVEVAAFSRSGVAPLVERYGIRPRETFDELLQACDVIDVCTPTGTHLGYVEAALRAGRDVICEKPVVRTAPDGARIAALAEAVGRQVYPAHVVRWFPAYATARAAVDDGTIGTPTRLTLSREGEFPSWAPWFADDEQSGGVVLDLMIHDLDAARWIAGEVAEVRATGSGSIAADGARRSSAEATMLHTGGAISTVIATWDRPGTPFRTGLRVEGSRGVFERDGDGDPMSHADGPGPAEAADDPYRAQLVEFLDALRGGPEPRVSLADGIRAVELAEAVAEAIQSGRTVSV